MGSLAPERLSALKQVATIESIASSTRIEGSRLSDQDVRRLLSRRDIQSFATRDEQEVAGYADVMEMIFSSWQDMTISENHIRQFHRDLLEYRDKDARHRGAYKTSPNSVSAFDADGRSVGVVFETATPFDTLGLMSELVDWYNATTETRAIHPLTVVAIVVVVFLEIHPFQDGNGRLNRVLTTLLRLRAGYPYMPYSSLESVIEQRKEQYYLALRDTQTSLRTEKPDWQPWLMFFFLVLRQQMRNLSAKVERERLLQTNLPELSVQVMGYLREHGRLTMKETETLTGVSRNTLKLHFKRLVGRELVELHGKG